MWFDGLTMQEICSNCGNKSGIHDGLAGANCPNVNGNGNRIGYNMASCFRYNGQDYGQVISEEDIHQNVSPSNVDDECKCGIRRVDCDYHKDLS